MKFSVENIRVGDVLLQDVINLNGTVVAKAGTVVDDISLRRFKIWSIKEIDVRSDNQEIHTAIDPDGESAMMGINPIMDKILMAAEKIKNQRINALVGK